MKLGFVSVTFFKVQTLHRVYPATAGVQTPVNSRKRNYVFTIVVKYNYRQLVKYNYVFTIFEWCSEEETFGMSRH